MGGNSLLSFRVISIPSNENAGYIHKYFSKASLKSFFQGRKPARSSKPAVFLPLNPSSLGTTKGQQPFGILQVILCKFACGKLEACYSPRSKRVTRLARSVLLALPEASCSPRSKRVARPARSELVAPLGACYSPHSKRVSRLARSELVAPLGACCSPRSEHSPNEKLRLVEIYQDIS